MDDEKTCPFRIEYERGCLDLPKAAPCERGNYGDCMLWDGDNKECVIKRIRDILLNAVVKE